MLDKIKSSYQEAAKYFSEFAGNEESIKTTNQIANLIADTFRNGNKVIVCGNGGSSTDAMHFAEEFTGRFRKAR
ncbi:MAG: SIS domain-containing protein, partial [Candidatus Cloacimonetes bacterium]|nr:SIS domain-containing protein [Candidatus Cloacimonadota bacterium]